MRKIYIYNIVCIILLQLNCLQVTEMKKEKTALVIPNAVQVGNLCANNLECFLNSLKSLYFGPIAQQKIVSDNTRVFSCPQQLNR